MPKIEKGIPFPKTREVKYPVRDMQVGDSFLITREDIALDPKSYLFKLAKQCGFKIATRKLPEGLRVWRLE